MSVDPNESQMWSKLLFLSPRELFSLIHDKDQEDELENNEQEELEEEDQEQEEHEIEEDENEYETSNSEDKTHSSSSSSGNSSLDDFIQDPSNHQNYNKNQSEEINCKSITTSQHIINKPTN